MIIELLETHRQLLRPIFTKHGGKEIETIGDAFFVEFRSALEAVSCAVEIQNTLHERNAKIDPEKKILLRIGYGPETQPTPRRPVDQIVLKQNS